MEYRNRKSTIYS